MERRKRIIGVDWRGLLVAAVFIALMYTDFFFCRGWLSGVVVGGVFAVLGVTLGLQNMWMIRVGQLVPATVVDHKEEHNDDEVHYIPIVEFSDRSGRKLRKQTDAGLGVKRPAVGTRVLVRYDPSGRLECQIMSAVRWIIPIGLLAAGVIVLGLTATKYMK
ncbi:MAG: hypothetical protein GX608_11085 [Lentisphaerae bacterium]|nr:hypothetical protein [Lentisphaerota bacterium]